ncbi:MAG: ribosome maturation factor RimP [Bacteroidetes bacterium]|nr:ribosome maturation factor RimP [Bacteroidota bacterium]
MTDPLFYFMAAPMDTIVKELTQNVVVNTDFKVVDVNVVHTQTKDILRVFLDNEQGITIGECQSIARQLGALLEAEHRFTRPFVLEVSSPGVDRPISEDWQFRKNVGRTVAIEFEDEKSGALQKAVATIERVEGDSVILIKRQKKEVHLFSIPLAQIRHAKVEINFSSKNKTK